MTVRLVESDRFERGLVESPADRLYERLPGPTLFHLPGRRPEPLFVSVLLHGDEWTGWMAVQEILRRYRNRELPRALSVLIGNVAAARAGVRYLPDQPDYNRIWFSGAAGTMSPEQAVMDQVFESVRARGVFASVDIHNNTGTNPLYACVRTLNARTLQLATLFGRTVVYFRKPDGVLTARLAPVCPAVTIECGRSGEPGGVARAIEFLDACLHLTSIPEHAVAARDLDLYHSAAVVKVPAALSLDFGRTDADICLESGLERLNFRELPAGTRIGWVRQAGLQLDVRDENGDDIAQHYLQYAGGEIRTRVPVMPSMLTASIRAIRQDCLCYLMERLSPQPV